jgi:hypothetical protein
MALHWRPNSLTRLPLEQEPCQCEIVSSNQAADSSRENANRSLGSDENDLHFE